MTHRINPGTKVRVTFTGTVVAKEMYRPTVGTKAEPNKSGWLEVEDEAGFRHLVYIRKGDPATAVQRKTTHVEWVS